MLQRIKESKPYVYAIIALLIILAAKQIVQAGGVEPGSQQDPLVTQSYVEQRNEQLKYYFEQRLQELSWLVEEIDSRITVLQGTADYTQPAGPIEGTLEIVEVPAGKILIGYSGTEIVLRGGRGTALQSPLGGLADLTGGRDIKQGEIIPDNHLLLIPRSDGRGIRTETGCIFMVKGKYDIE